MILKGTPNGARQAVPLLDEMVTNHIDSAETRVTRDRLSRAGELIDLDAAHRRA